MRHLIAIALAAVLLVTCRFVRAQGAATASAGVAIRVSNYTDGTVVRHPVLLLVGEVADGGLTAVTVVNTSSQRPTREMNGLAYQGKFKVLTELVPGLNKLVVRAGKQELPLTLTYKPQTNPYVVRVIWATDNTGDTTYQTPYPNDKQDYAAKLDTMAKLMQTFTAERLHDQGYGRKTFNLELDEQGKVKVHVFKGEKPASAYYEMKDQAWWGHMYGVLGKPFPMEKGKNVVVAAYTRFDPETGNVKGHTALGGGGLGLFGGGDVWAWPSDLQEVQTVFMDAQLFDPKKIFSDSVGRHTRWAIASTTIGATLHELCHTFGLPHTNDPYDIMTRGIDYFNRAFTLVEPPHAGRKSPLAFTAGQVAYFPPVSAGLLVASRWFALDQLQDPARFAAWLRRVAFGVTMNWLKAFRPGLFQHFDGKGDLDTLDIPDFHPGPAEIAEQRDLADAVMRAVASLPPRYRIPLTMFHLDGLSYEKVADFLDIPLGTAKSLIHRAREKLKAALQAAAGAEVTPMLQDVFREHKLPAGFAGKVIANVPALRWGAGKDCTFAGALEAATAVTPHPCRYPDIMGWTGLALRTRWFVPNERARWCGSCAVGEMNEEIDAFARHTGWPLDVKVEFDPAKRQQHLPALTASIDAGRPVAAYTDNLDVAVAFGYSDAGRTLYFRDYHRGDLPLEQSVSPLGWLWMILGEHEPPPPPTQVFRQSLEMAIHHWKREKGRAGPGWYWYGDAAYREWLADLAKAATVPAEELPQFFQANYFAFASLLDARTAAATFLRDHAALLGPAASAAFHRAADLCAGHRPAFAALQAAGQPCFLNPFTGNAPAAWTDEIRQREIALLTAARARDTQTIALIEQALQP